MIILLARLARAHLHEHEVWAAGETKREREAAFKLINWLAILLVFEAKARQIRHYLLAREMVMAPPEVGGKFA